MTDPQPAQMVVPTRLIAEAAESAALVFEDNQWVWGRDDERHIPSAAEIALRFQRLITQLSDRSGDSRSTGRLVVARNDLGITLSIELATHHVETDP